MQVHRYSQSLPPFHKAVITIGTFDGVHQGHRKIVAQLKAAARDIGGETVIITFTPHPRRVVGGQQNDLRLLNTLQERIELLGQTGIDHLVIVPFTEDFAKQPALDYVNEFLVKHFSPSIIIIGYDHHFGRNREGNYQLLEALKYQHHYQIQEINGMVYNGTTLSSTAIRQALLNGNVQLANEYLGYPYFLQGTIVEGKKLGRTLGYPTANIRLNDEEKLVPANGVYAVKACLISPDQELQTIPLQPNLWGMMNIGMRPTVDGTSRTIEVNLFDFDRDIYGKDIRVFLYNRLRGEIKFESLFALKTQLAQDEIHSRKVLGQSSATITGL